MNELPKTAVVIGAGPAGLMAANELALAGHKVIVVDGKPSPARKFLMAGKSGLNLTKDEPIDVFLKAYTGPPHFLDMVAKFGPTEVSNWAEGLGQALFTGSSGRVFPKAMKASPLLRAWLLELDRLGVTLKTSWSWTGWQNDKLVFSTPDGAQTLTSDATVLALGGGSWARLGSDGAWTNILKDKGVVARPFLPSNVGIKMNWSAHMERHFGRPVKSIRLNAKDTSVHGEFILSSRGLEGSAIYGMTAALWNDHPIFLDLMPQRTTQEIAEKIDRPRGKNTLTNHLRKSLKLDATKLALLQEMAHPLPKDPAKISTLIKALPIKHQGARPIDEAISTAGGLDFEALDETLMCRNIEGVFACGEMLDWDAPTGGYLVTACLATGKHAGQSASAWLAKT